MIAVTENVDTYLASFSRLEREKEFPGQGQGWIDRVRKQAIERFAELGFPTKRDEDWKYTSVAPIASVAFQPPRSDVNGNVASRIKRSGLLELDCSCLVFINGRYAPELSSLTNLAAQVKASDLPGAFAENPQALEQHLGRYAAFTSHPFVALNTALFESGAFVSVPRGVVLEKPIYLFFVSTHTEEPAVTHPRNLIVADRESQATFIEAYVGLEAAPQSRKSKSEAGFENPLYFTNAVTEIVVGEDAVVRHVKIQQEGERAFHVGSVQVQQARSSNVTNHSIALGGALDREDVNVVLGGEGAENFLSGLYVVTGTQHVDNHTTIDHAKPHCNSREVYKGILDGHSQGVFNGKILVRKDAQKTDAKQSNKNLLLSEDAVINTKPQLEIYADDVKCTHGATIGQIDPEALFYLRSRGIGREEARSLLTYAFANDVLERINDRPLRDRLKDTLFARLGRQQKSETRSAKEARSDDV